MQSETQSLSGLQYENFGTLIRARETRHGVPRNYLRPVSPVSCLQICTSKSEILGKPPHTLDLASNIYNMLSARMTPMCVGPSVSTQNAYNLDECVCLLEYSIQCTQTRYEKANSKEV